MRLLRRFFSAAISAVMGFSCVPLSAAAKGSEPKVTHCTIRGYEDFYYFPVKACDGGKYYIYVSNLGNGCVFSMDSVGADSSFGYPSDYAAPHPAKTLSDISLKEMNGILTTFDHTNAEQCLWLKRVDEKTFNQCISVIKDLKLTKKFDGDIKKLTPCEDYNNNWAGLCEVVNRYVFYHSIEAEFYSYNGKTVVKLSGEDQHAFLELMKKNGKTLPSPKEAYDAYYASSEFEGYFYCDPQPLEDYFGRAGEKPLKKAKTYYTDPAKTNPLPKQDIKGKKLSYFIDKGDFKPEDSEYFIIGNAAVCAPEGTISCSAETYQVFFDIENDNEKYRADLAVLNDKKMKYPKDIDYTLKKSGTFLGKPCRYYEGFLYEGYYTAGLMFQIDGKYYEARAGVYDNSYNTDFRKFFRQFFGSIKRASEVSDVKFGDAPAEYFKDAKISKYTKACTGLELYVPKGLETSGEGTYFSAQEKNNGNYSLILSAYIETAEDGETIDRNVHKYAYYKYSYGSNSVETKISGVYNFRRGGANCTLAVIEEMGFYSGWKTEYIYYIDCGKKLYGIHITVPEKSKYKKEDVIKILSSIRFENA